MASTHRVENTKAGAAPVTSQSPRGWIVYLVVGFVFLFAAILVRRAWLSDDAFITFRTIDNFINGLGLVWNVGERVQAFTHPLWLLVLSSMAFFTRELIYTSLIVSILLSLVSVLLVITRLSVSKLSAAFVTLIALLSNSFIDYSTSGLENPLTHLLLIVFFTIYFTGTATNKRLFWLSLVASLGALNRLDTILLFLPALLLELLEIRSWKGLALLLAGQLPLILWLVFSVVYYGFPFPNTAYAKLNTGIGELDLIRQGLLYYLHAMRSDPLSLVVIGSAIILGLLSRQKQMLTIAAGMVFYLAYLVWIGGDFMSGRFLAAPFVCGLVILARIDLNNLARWLVGILFGVVIILGFISPTPTLDFWEADLTAKQRSAMVNDSKITNERRYYGWATSLLRLNQQAGFPAHPYALDGLEARQKGSKLARRITVGMFGYYAGPHVFVVDELALGDALLARLPARRDIDWRIGHFQRTIPDGYLDTLRSGQNQISDASLAEYYDNLQLIIKGPLFAPGRLPAIWKINTRQFDRLIDFDTYRYPKMVQADQEQVNHPKPARMAWDAPGNIIFNDSGLEILMNGVKKPTALEMSLNAGAVYEVQFRKDGREVGREIVPDGANETGLQITCIELPPDIQTNGFDTVRIFPLAGEGNFSLGHLKIGACQESLRFLALGDSYTIGQGVSANERWPVQLAEQLRLAGYGFGEPEIIARTGWTTGELLNGIQTAKPQGPYDLVSILIGVNNQYLQRPIAEYRDQFSMLLEQAIAFSGGNPKRVIVVSIPDWGMTPFARNAIRPGISQEIDAFNQVARQETENAGAWFVDITQQSRLAPGAPGMLAADGLHPAGKMYSSWVEIIKPVVINTLSE